MPRIAFLHITRKTPTQKRPRRSGETAKANWSAWIGIVVPVRSEENQHRISKISGALITIAAVRECQGP